MSKHPQIHKKKYNANTVNKESDFFNLIYFSWSIAQGKHSYNVLYFPGKFWVLSWFIFYCFIFFIFLLQNSYAKGIDMHDGSPLDTQMII